MMSEELDVLNSAEYLYLSNISEPRDNSLRLVVEEAISNKAAKGRPSALNKSAELESILKDAWPIESVEGCRAFELHWKRYAAYLVTEELVGGCGEYDDEVYSGKILRVYTKSHFLEHLARDTGGHTDPLIHYKVVCLNHLIDVASYVPPDIREVAIADEGRGKA